MPLQFKDIKTGKLRGATLENTKQTLSPREYYAYVLNGDYSLDIVKDARIHLLKYECSSAIYNGFVSSVTNGSGVAYEFGFNEHDQQNFDQQYLLIVSGDNAGATINWKTKNLGVVELTEDDFKQIVQDAKAHKLAQQTKYWDLEAQVLSATTIEEVEAVVW
jgi:hypothetical protein